MDVWPNLHPQIHSRFIPVNDLDMHVLEAHEIGGDRSQRDNLVILLHGFPELAYSWRKIIWPLCAEGFHVIAPDQRGYGRTKIRGATDSPQIRYDDPLPPYRMLNLVKDIIALALGLGYTSVHTVIGHDFGSVVAAHCALIRPDFFKSVVIMSAPYAGPPPLLTPSAQATAPLTTKIQLSDLQPPRKHYTAYFTTREANDHMRNAPQGIHTFIRSYFYMKSGDWPHNNPHPLPSTAASGMAILPHYYIMPLDSTMPEVVQNEEPSSETISKADWLADDELAVYTAEYSRTGFQGGLNWYRCMTDRQWTSDLEVYTGRKIEIPAMFLSGKKDWGVFQSPGAFETMQERAFTRMEKDDVVLLDDAGHWVQQEQPKAVVEHLLRFLCRKVK